MGRLGVTKDRHVISLVADGLSFVAGIGYTHYAAAHSSLPAHTHPGCMGSPRWPAPQDVARAGSTQSSSGQRDFRLSHSSPTAVSKIVFSLSSLQSEYGN